MTPRVYRTEDAVVNAIFAMSKRHPGCWPGYKRVSGGFVTTFDADPLPLPPDPTLPAPGDDEDPEDDGYGPWRDSEAL